jgi:hypothetical protein
LHGVETVKILLTFAPRSGTKGYKALKQFKKYFNFLLTFKIFVVPLQPRLGKQNEINRP